MRSSLRRVNELTGILPDTVRGWVDWVRVEAGQKPGVVCAEREEIMALR